MPPQTLGEIPDEHAVDNIATAFLQVFSATASDAERAMHLEDAESIGIYEEEPGRRRHGQRLIGCQVEQIHFTSSDRASVRFSLSDGAGRTIPVDGIAVYHDGQWKVSRQTSANLLRRGNDA